MDLVATPCPTVCVSSFFRWHAVRSGKHMLSGGNLAFTRSCDLRGGSWYGRGQSTQCVSDPQSRVHQRLPKLHWKWHLRIDWSCMERLAIDKGPDKKITQRKQLLAKARYLGGDNPVG